jgi:methylglutaconyl-CoA hydratase
MQLALDRETRRPGLTKQTISVDLSPRRVATVRFNRPERGNAFDQTMLNELSAEFARLAADDSTRVVVLRANGRHFCTGADLAARGDGQHGVSSPGPQASLPDVLAALDALPKPTVAVVQGGAIGGGAAFATCCDVVIAADSAFFAIPEVRVGMAPLGVAPFLIRAMGHRGFRRYGLTGERIPAAIALRLGLTHEVCDAAQLDDVLARITDDLLHGAPGAIAELKEAADRYAVPSLAAIRADGSAPHRPQSPEAREGIASFREKRKPSWYPQ